MKLHAVYHYSVEDPEMWGDYHSVDLFVDDKEALSLGDEYHDKSDAQIEGFKAALKFLKMKFKFTKEMVADSEE